jgi:ectoine hydroxylase-related dioxygenase (phytanoyl-CoA dioxygenase family)
LAQSSVSRADGEGGAIKLKVENELTPGTIYDAIFRSRRLVEPMQALLGDEVYHWHHKMIFKEARVGGAWAWHQDYGYWYNNACLFPDLASCLIAVDQATKENGCLQVLKGSHLLGRIDHGKTGDQTGADLERVEQACKVLERVYVELRPGSGIFFHGNVLHRSDQNTSDKPRWAFICCYNTRRNSPYKETRHPAYSPMSICDDTEVLRIARAHKAKLLGS